MSLNDFTPEQILHLTKPELCLLAMVYYECTVRSRSTVRQVYDLNADTKIAQALRSLAKLKLVRVKDHLVVAECSAKITTQGKKVLESHLPCDIVHILDEFGWYILAGDFIERLHTPELCEFFTHEREYYRHKALQRYGVLCNGTE